MLKYFSRKENLSDVLDYINTKQPKIVIAEYNCLVDNRLYRRDDDNGIYVLQKFKDFLHNDKTIEFKIIDNKFELKDMIDGLKVNDFYEPILQQQEISRSLMDKYNDVIHGTNNIWSVKLDDYKKNNLLYMLINDELFENIDIYLLFSTLYDAITFLLVHELKPNIHVVVFDIQTRYNNKFKNEMLKLTEERI